jgi:hypothetical protein
MADKNPDRVLAGRLGALTVHAAGRTNTSPARASFMARFEREVDPEGALPAVERARRAEYARTAYFTRLAIRSRRSRKASITAT